MQCSEDALVVWVGSNIAKGVYGGWQQNLWVLSIIYFGVVVSDMVSITKECGNSLACFYLLSDSMPDGLQVTFYMGVGLKMGFFKKLKDSLFR